MKNLTTNFWRQLITGGGSTDREKIEQLDSSEAGMTTAEYAVGTVAAAGFAGLLLTLVKGGSLSGLLLGLLKSALSI